MGEYAVLAANQRPLLPQIIPFQLFFLSPATLPADPRFLCPLIGMPLNGMRLVIPYSIKQFSQFPVNSVTKGRYTYVHQVSKASTEAIDVHHIIVQTSGDSYLSFCTYALLLSIICGPILLLFQDKPAAFVLWSFNLAGFLLMHLRRRVEKESVIIFPSLGVQFETLYKSGKTDRQFVPIGKILKPVLNECVTPVTCYWSLSLILHEKEELLLVLKKSYPPVKMLVPIWEALFAATDNEECCKLYSDCNPRCSGKAVEMPPSIKGGF